ncbi:phage terminase small subunit P27 family [Rhizobium deserti]|uniref:Phage terminase small subunit P27 family n=1 Tax=Rhizobium deserti TaxID=2547961 RepID=A0A4R5ULL0_9HYPH|nr:phage terminase small subunit P27 family [Rhizobium deserti]TDK38608.1 phage terminase small subunit P27 family [Rhizobium deserti]
MKGRKAELKAIEGGLAGVPSPPGEIPADMVAEWQVIAAELAQRKLLTASMAGILSTYVMALKNVRTFQKSIDQHGELVTSAHGHWKPNPAAGMQAKAMEMVARLGAELGLTPAARAKQGFQKGEKKPGGAPDGLDI